VIETGSAPRVAGIPKGKISDDNILPAVNLQAAKHYPRIVYPDNRCIAGTDIKHSNEGAGGAVRRNIG
jgi:hypothetical protein